MLPMVLSPHSDLMIAEEVANLKLEAEALKEIKQSIGTKDFANKVFEKVFNTDIQRLLSMSDMWKSRTPPKPLEYAAFTLPDEEASAALAKDDQPIWDLQTNVAVFKYRSFPSSRYLLVPLQLMLICSLN